MGEVKNGLPRTYVCSVCVQGFWLLNVVFRGTTPHAQLLGTSFFRKVRLASFSRRTDFDSFRVCCMRLYNQFANLSKLFNHFWMPGVVFISLYIIRTAVSLI